MEEKKTKTDPRQLGYAKKYDNKFEKYLVRLDVGTSDRVSKLGYASVSRFVRLAVAEKLEREEQLLGKKKT